MAKPQAVAAIRAVQERAALSDGFRRIHGRAPLNAAELEKFKAVLARDRQELAALPAMLNEAKRLTRQKAQRPSPEEQRAAKLIAEAANRWRR
jgi:hypothetical protein